MLSSNIITLDTLNTHNVVEKLAGTLETILK